MWQAFVSGYVFQFPSNFITWLCTEHIIKIQIDFINCQFNQIIESSKGLGFAWCSPLRKRSFLMSYFGESLHEPPKPTTEGKLEEIE